MTEIVRVYGSSAAGKETFIRNITTNPPQKVLASLWWGGKKIFSVQESIQYIGQFENDPIVNKRSEIIEKVKSLVAQKPNSVVLIKGQDVDFTSDLLNKLRSEIPTVEHKIIFLHTTLEELLKRCRTKSWWDQWDEKAGIPWIKVWLFYQVNALQKLKGFPIIALDSGTYAYTPIHFPPEIE